MNIHNIRAHHLIIALFLFAFTVSTVLFWTLHLIPKGLLWGFAGVAGVGLVTSLVTLVWRRVPLWEDAKDIFSITALLFYALWGAHLAILLTAFSKDLYSDRIGFALSASMMWVGTEVFGIIALLILGYVWVQRVGIFGRLRSRKVN